MEVLLTEGVEGAWRIFVGKTTGSTLFSISFKAIFKILSGTKSVLWVGF